MAIPAEDPTPRIIARPDHVVSRKNIHPNALKVLYRLDRLGYEAYMVGGGVRDLMLGRQPKDYDIATSAHPEEIRSLFHNSRIIGRRFRLVHIFFREGLIEVSTFRGRPDPGAQRRPGEGLVTNDNTFGTPSEDAFRRDFTVNALFYRISDFCLVDYVGGVQDLEDRLIRVIGDPDVRFREDPVRMLRACELAARLQFGIDEGAQDSIRRHRLEIRKSSPGRMVEELLQILRCGDAGVAIQWMHDLGLTGALLTEVDAMLRAEDEGLGSMGGLVAAIDERVRAGEDLSDSLLFAVLLAPQIALRRHRIEANRRRPLSRRAVQDLVHQTLHSFGERFLLSNLRRRRIAQTLEVFQRLCEPAPAGWDYRQVTSHGFFAEALRLFELFVNATGQGRTSLDAWRLAAQNAEEAPSAPGRRRRRRHRRR